MAKELLLFILFSSPILLITLITFLMIISFRPRLINDTENKYRNLPPGDLGGLPFIGDTFAFMRPHSSASLGEFVDQQIARHGRIFKMKLFGKATIVSADPDMNRFILQNEEKLFQCSYPKGVENIMGKRSMLALTGEIHKEMRSIAVNFVSNFKLSSSFFSDIEEQAVEIISGWRENITFSGHEEAKKFAFNLMVKYLMSMSMSMSMLERTQLREEYTTFMKGMASIPINLPGTAHRKALQEEHTKIARRKVEMGETTLTWDDHKKMEFTKCVINETLILGNIVKFLHRKAITDVQFKGYDIPCGWGVIPIISAEHLDPSIYENPQQFNPWRCQNVTKKKMIMSFSGGPRLCPGAELAKLEMAILLHHLVQKYDWELAEHDFPVSFPFLEFPNGLPIKLHSLSMNF